MGFGMVRLASTSCGASGVKVSQAGIAQSVGGMKRRQHTFHHQLRITVKIRRLQRVIFLNRNLPRFTVYRRGGGKHESMHSVFQDSPQERERSRRVVVEILLGLEHGLSSFDEGGEVHHGIEAPAREDGLERGLVSRVRQDELGLSRHGPYVTL